MSFDLGKLFIEWRRIVPNGVPNPNNDYHLVLLKEICLAKGIDKDVVDNVILTLEKKEIDPDTKIKYKYKDPKGNEKDMETTYDKAINRDKEHPAYKAAKALQDKEGGKKSGKDSTSVAGPKLADTGFLTSKDDNDIKDKTKEKGIVVGDSNEGDNQVKNDMFKYGYGKFKKNTGTKPAPGGAGSAFNEIVSGEGVHILKENPNLKEEELARDIYEKTKDTELGNEQKKTTGVGKIPKDIENDKLWSKCVIAARSSRKKYDRTIKRVERLQEQKKFGKPQKISTFYGAQSSLDAQVEIVENANTILTPKGRVVKLEDAIAFIKDGGGGMNPSDTGTFVQDDNGNLLIQFHSDKTTTGDIQDNSTLIKEGENYKEYLEKEDLTDEERGQANDLVDEYSKKITEIEENYNKQAIPISKRLMELPIEDQVKMIEEDKGTLKKNLNVAIYGENFPDGNNTVGRKYQNYVPTEKEYPNNASDLTTEEKLEMVKKLVSDGNGVGNDTKVVNKLSEALLRKDPSIEGLNVKKNLSDQREKVVGLQRERLNKLNELKPGLGISMEANEAERAFHLNMMDYPPKEYEEGNPNSLMGETLDVNMGGNIVNGEVLKNCLGVENSKEFKERFRLEESDDLTYADEEETIVTGKKVFTYAIDTKTNERIDLGYKTYRSKNGAAGKTNNTMTYSTEMQNCFKGKN